MFTDEELKSQLRRVLASIEQLLPQVVDKVDWANCRAANWRRHSFAGHLEAITEIDPVTLDDLLGIDQQKQILDENTRQFVQGFPANNVLLWGTRGTGKSTLVRALLNAYADQGLRVIQVDKDDLVNLAEVFAAIKGRSFGLLSSATTSLLSRANRVTKC